MHLPSNIIAYFLLILGAVSIPVARNTNSLAGAEAREAGTKPSLAHLVYRKLQLDLLVAVIHVVRDRV